MNKVPVTLALIAWLLSTIALTFSVIGMLLLIPGDYEPSTWMKIGKALTKTLLN